MNSVCKLYSNNPEPDHLVLYFDKDGKEIFRIEFRTTDKTKEFEAKYDLIQEKILSNAPGIWNDLTRSRNFRKQLRGCQWIETRVGPAI